MESMPLSAKQTSQWCAKSGIIAKLPPFSEVPSSIIFGEMNSNNEFNKARKESNKDGFVVFAKDYMETLV